MVGANDNRRREKRRASRVAAGTEGGVDGTNGAKGKGGTKVHGTDAPTYLGDRSADYVGGPTVGSPPSSAQRGCLGLPTGEALGSGTLGNGSICSPEADTYATPTYLGESASPEAEGISRGRSKEPMAPRKAPEALTAFRVTDDLGEYIEIRQGESLILGRLIDSVIDDFKTKAANEG